MYGKYEVYGKIRLAGTVFWQSNGFGGSDEGVDCWFFYAKC